MPKEKCAEPTGERDRVIEFLRLLWAVEHAMLSASKTMQRRFGVTSQQCLAIKLIGATPGISPGELADIFHVDPSTMTGIVRSLEDRLFVRRLRDNTDRRRARLELTSKGRQIELLRSGTIETAVAKALNGLEGDDLTTTSRVMTVLERELLRIAAHEEAPAAVTG